MGGNRLSWLGCAGLVTFAALAIVGILADASAAGAVDSRAQMLASMTALECLVLIAVLRPSSFTHLDGGRAMVAFALSVPWSALQLIEHMDVSPGFGVRVVWLLVAQTTLLIIAGASWAHCRWGLVEAVSAPRARALR